ncbi:SycD/LcrH family type III secretion system chaperone [Vibrio neptunius]|uniref:SycD/LcrH family type III secretion system chaperone n=1 Tax=Vibrio neptunius TaxID=170651 RepID=UPI0019CFEB68|nr:SycD/LcrH family type III secretion system chaperone [Vibrio neptunius]MBN3571849.1 SycD/LcrH family type III secretion system chaperone [Vibrio neptunius]QXX05601.1 SycD/LcrH family type III secretion system chaperone [Vibrio neptunius]
MVEKDFETLQAFLQQGGSLKMLADVEQKDLDLLYQYGTQLMNYGDYQGAKRIFYLLMKIDQWNFDYFFALGTCCQQLKQYEEAIFCFGRAGIVKVEDPRAPYFAGNNYLALGNNEYAIKSYQASLRVCDCHPDGVWDEIAEKANKALAQFTQEVHHD